MLKAIATDPVPERPNRETVSSSGLRSLENELVTTSPKSTTLKNNLL